MKDISWKTVSISVLLMLLVLSVYDNYTKGREQKIIEDTAVFLDGYPPIRVINFERMTTELLARNHSPAEVVEYGELMIRYFSNQGYLILESQAIVTQPEELKLQFISLDKLREATKKLGINSALKASGASKVRN